MRLLFIVPYTPNLIRVRPFQLIRALRRQGHEITLATLWADQQEQNDITTLEGLGINVVAERLTKVRSVWNVTRAIPSNRPLQTDFCWHPMLAQRLIPLLIQEAFDAVHVEHLRGALYGLHVKRTMTSSGMSRDVQIPIIWDSVDCISHLFSQAATRSHSMKGRLMTRLDLKRTRHYEGYLVNQFDHVTTTSAADTDALAKLAATATHFDAKPGLPHVDDGGTNRSQSSKISTIPNGVDLEYFQPQASAVLGDMATMARLAAVTPTNDAPTVVFSGKMSYHANITAARYLVDEIMPHVWARYPEVQVQLVGKDPAPEVRKLMDNRGNDGAKRVLVTGTVPDLRPYLTKATIAVAPVLYGAGIQNKVLEAMACGAPVIASSQAASGVAAEPENDLLVAADTQSFCDAILDLLNDANKRAVLSKAGRRYVEAHHSWDWAAEKFTQLYSSASMSLS